VDNYCTVKVRISNRTLPIYTGFNFHFLIKYFLDFCMNKGAKRSKSCPEAEQIAGQKKKAAVSQRNSGFFTKPTKQPYFFRLSRISRSSFTSSDGSAGFTVTSSSFSVEALALLIALTTMKITRAIIRKSKID
jgi:hypothetical protein